MRLVISATPFGIGMEAVAQVEAAVERDAVEKERIEDQLVLPGKLWIHGIECACIILAQVARGEHAGQQNFGAVGFQRGDDLFQVCLGASRVETAQRIVGTELQDHGIRALRDRPAYPLEAVCRRIARNTGIDHLYDVTLGLERALELCGKSVGGFELKAGDQAVAEHDDADRRSWLCKGSDGNGGNQAIAEENSQHHVCQRRVRCQCPHRILVA